MSFLIDAQSTSNLAICHDQFISIMEDSMESLNVAMEEICLEVSVLNPDNKEEEINQRYAFIISLT